MTHPAPQFVKPEFRKLATVAVLVRDYDEAAAWYRTKLGFVLIEDTDLGNDKRWVVVAPSVRNGARILLAKASNEAQEQRVGDQTGGRVGFFFETDDIARDFERMRSRGVKFLESPRSEPYGIVAVFADLYGNLFDLIQPATR